MHNGYPNNTNPASNLELEDFDQLVESFISSAMFEKIQTMDTVSALNRFLPVPLNPSLSVDISIGLGMSLLGRLM